MEAATAAAVAACPAQFTGQAGALFAHALGAVLAAHCARADTAQWPSDHAEELLRAGGGSYDFVVVGAGSAGSLLASRLGEVGAWRALLLEAGDTPTFDSEVPAFLFSNQDTKQDWQHKTSKNTNHCLSSIGGVCKWAKGKGLGGSTSINAMLYVRGNQADYDSWEAAGNPGWGYKSVLPYFMKTENFSVNNHFQYNRKYHGNGGVLNIEPFAEPQNPWKEVISTAWKELGYRYNEDINGESQIGISNAPGSVKDGRRNNSAKHLLSEAVRRGNLHIMKNTIVTKVIIDHLMKRATGVEVKHAGGAVMQIKATKEVILSAGTIKTPQLLMLSGIGPREHLERMNIETLIDLPVGKNLQDHPIFPIFAQLPTDKSTSLTDEDVIQFMLQYMLTRQGPFRGIGMTNLLGFVDTKNNSEVPDIQFHHIYFSRDDRVILPAYRKATGYVDEFWDNLGEMNKNNDVIGIYPTLLHPRSRGEILLTNTDPEADPEIHAGYFDEEEDIDTLIRGAHFVLKLLNTTVFREVGAKVHPFNLRACLSPKFGSEEYWRCYIRHVASTIYHPVGTSKMGPPSAGGVVGAELRVHGARGLRVVDASVMPTLPSGNTMAATLMIAEKAADLIKQYWSTADKSEL